MRYFNFLCSLLLAVSALFLNLNLTASHISGVNITYECISGNDYLVTVNLFRDCQDLNDLPLNLSVFIGSTCLNIGYKAFPQVDLIEVSQLCEAQLANSTCNGGFQPGVQMGVYKRIIELEPCIDWRFTISEQNRDAAIVNLANPEQFSVHTSAFLNNSQNICNDSPQLSLLNLPNVCVGTALYYNLGFIDPDGDSLSYALVPALASVIPNIPFEMDYTGSYSGEEPMTGMTIDPINGQISVTPTQLGKFNTVVEVSEYRDGYLIGIVHYDFLFLVNACAIPPPEPDMNSFAQVSGGGYPIDENTIGICAQDDFCFEIAFTSVDPSINVDLSSNLDLLIPGVTETVTGTNPATIRFCGSLPPNFNEGSFIITAIDDACPVYGQNFYTIDFEFRQPIKAYGDTTICFGQSVEISAMNDTIYNWYSLSGELLSAPDDISCNPCSNAMVTPEVSTYYIVEGQYSGSSCAHRDTLFIDVALATEIVRQDETCTGNDGVIDVSVLTGSGNYDVIWEDIGEGPLVRSDLSAGEYYLLIFDNAYNCNRIDTFNIIQLPPPTADAGDDFEICSLTANLAAVPSFGISTWEAIPGVIFSDNSDANSSVTVSSEGTYNFVWTEDAGIGCVESDTVEVTFYAPASAQILSADSVCGLQFNADAMISNGSLQWWASPGLIIDDPFSVTPQIQAAGYGYHSLYLELNNGLCHATDSIEILFIEQPGANAGGDIETCGNEVLITAVDQVGDGEWILPEAIASEQSLTNESITIESAAYGNFDLVRIVTNLAYCVAYDTVVVQFTEIPAVDLGSDQNICDSLTLLDFNLPIGDLNWELSPNLISGSIVTSPQLLTGTFGNHQAILHADNGYGCTNSDTLNLNFVAQPQLSSVVADTVCDVNYVFSAESIGENHYWLQPEGANISDLADPNAAVTVESEGNYIFKWVVENEFCRDTALTQVRFYNQPVSNAGDDLMICGLSASLDAVPSYGLLLWHDQPGLTFSNPLNAHSNLTAGSYGSYTVSLTEINGICTDADSLEIVFISAPQIINPLWECTGADTEFILSFDLSGGDSTSYQVEGLTGEVIDFHFISDELLSETAVEVILNDLGYCGGDTLAGTIFCPILTNAGIMNPDTIRLCGNELVEAFESTGAVLDGNDTLLYAFHDGSGNMLGTVLEWNNQPEFLFSGELDFNQTYFISAVAGNEFNGGVDLNDPFLSVSAGTPVEFYELPYGEISGIYNACPYDTIYIPVELSGAMPQEITYAVAGQIYSVFTDTPDFSLAIVDSGLVNLISTNSEFCTGEVMGSASLSYHGIPDVSISEAAILCSGDTAMVEVHFNGIAPFSGNIFQNGDLIQNINTTADSIVIFTTTGGIYSVVNFSDQYCNFTDTISTNFIFKPLPVVSAGSDKALCKGDSVLIGSNAIAGQQYVWQSNSALPITNLAEVTFIASLNSPFIQISQVVVTAELNGCFAADSALITVHPLPVPQIIGPASVCSDDSVTLIAYGGNTYSWSPAAFFQDPEAGVSKFSASANSEIELTAISEAGCETTISTFIEVLQSPVAAFTVSDMSGCAPLTVDLVALSGNNQNAYNWNITGATNMAHNANVNLKLEKAGEYTISLTVIAPNGCTKTEQLPDVIEVFSASAAYTYSPEKPDINNPELYFTNLSPGGVNARWTVDSLLFSESWNAAYTFPQIIGGEHTVCLEVTDINACKANFCRIIKLKNDFEIYVPTAFTPDGDGINDLFYPVLSNIDLTEYRFWITDSRGRTVFSTTDTNGKWDGGSNDSAYFGENKIYNWHVVAKPAYNVETSYFTGHVMLLR